MEGKSKLSLAPGVLSCPAPSPRFSFSRSFSLSRSLSPLLRLLLLLGSLSLRTLRLRLASACFLVLATRSLWHAMHQIPAVVLAKMSSSILLEHDRQRKQSA